MGVVIELAAPDERMHVCRELVELETGDKAGEIVGMGADIAGGAARSRLLGIGTPCGLLLTGLLDGLGEPILWIFGLNHSDFAELAGERPWREPAAPSDSPYSCASAQRASDSSAIFRSFLASARLEVSGLSHIT